MDRVCAGRPRNNAPELYVFISMECQQHSYVLPLSLHPLHGVRRVLEFSRSARDWLLNNERLIFCFKIYITSEAAFVSAARAPDKTVTLIMQPSHNREAGG